MGYSAQIIKNCCPNCAHYTSSSGWTCCDSVEMHVRFWETISPSLDYYKDKYPDYGSIPAYRGDVNDYIDEILIVLEEDFKFNDCPVYQRELAENKAKEEAARQAQAEADEKPVETAAPEPSQPQEDQKETSPEAHTDQGRPFWKKK